MPRSTYQFQRSCEPVLVPLLVGAGLDEELHLHLLELAGAEDEVARRDLVAEALADLRDAERRLAPRRVQHVEEVDEDALRGLRPQVVHVVLRLDRAEERLQHHVEVTRLGPLAAGAAVRARDVGQPVLRRLAVLGLVRLFELVGAVPLVAVQALDERVGEHVQVAGGLPHLRGEDDRGVQADDVVAAGDHRLPPLPADVVLEFDAERAVVPRRPGATVDLAGREDEAAPLAQVDDGIVAGGGQRRGLPRHPSFPVERPGYPGPGGALSHRSTAVGQPVHQPRAQGAGDPVGDVVIATVGKAEHHEQRVGDEHGRHHLFSRPHMNNTNRTVPPTCSDGTAATASPQPRPCSSTFSATVRCSLLNPRLVIQLDERVRAGTWVRELAEQPAGARVAVVHAERVVRVVGDVGRHALRRGPRRRGRDQHEQREAEEGQPDEAHRPAVEVGPAAQPHTQASR